MTEAVDAILLRWNEQNFQHYCTVARVDTGTVWTARPAVQHALRDLVQSSKLADALTLSPGRARAACVSLLGSLRNDAPIGFGTCWEVFLCKTKQFNVPRGNDSAHYVAITRKLQDILELPWDHVSQMVTLL